MKQENVELSKLTTQSAQLIQSAAARKNITFKDETAPGMYARGDKSKMDIIIRNLVSNAVKFTPPGGR